MAFDIRKYNFTEDLKIRTRKYIDIMNRGYYCDASQLTADFNAIMGTKRPVTHCASCLRQMISTLRAVLRDYEKEEARLKIAEEAEKKAAETLSGDSLTTVKAQDRKPAKEQKKGK